MEHMQGMIESASRNKALLNLSHEQKEKRGRADEANKIDDKR